jgi:anaerobic magnesium-protoporphyrin IX monomethyl ester cyclase
MSVLLANIPFIKYDEHGNIHTGPNAGSRWPWTTPGVTDYACFPFFMGYATRYLKENGVDASFYDGVAEKHWTYDLVKESIAKHKPEILFLETSTPLVRKVTEFAIWAKESFGSRIVLMGPHMQAYAGEMIKEHFVDHCIIGEYEKPALDIVLKRGKAKPIYTFEQLEDINYINGQNFLPFRPFELLFNYWEPTMNTPRPQLQVNTSRGCPFKCTYCQWPKVMNDGQYRNRLPELVIDEIRTVLNEYKGRKFDYSDRLRNAYFSAQNYRGKRQPFIAAASNALWGRGGQIQSILFDDDTWNLGITRVKELSRGLKEIGLPWTMMGRIDTSQRDVYDTMVDSGCVGMRFGVESFNQRLLDNTKKHLDAKMSYENIKYLLTRFSNVEFHFTTMKNLPGETMVDWENDLRILNELKQIGEKSGNRVHWQNSDCVAFPGTELWEEMVALGKGEELKNFDLYDGNPQNQEKLAEVIGWLGSDYTSKWSKYSEHGRPTNLPKS